MRGPRARRVPVDEPLLGDDRYDYADAFEIDAREADPRSAEEFARYALEQASAPMRWVIRFVHTRLLLLRLAPLGSPDHVLGWEVTRSEPDVVQLEARSPLLGRGVIVGRRVSPTSTRITTFVVFARPVVRRVVWTMVGPLHRTVAPYLLERAARGGGR